MLIDTHAHVVPAFYSNLDEVIQGIQDAHITKVINIGTNIEESKQTIDICAKYPSLFFPAIGLHPEIAIAKDKDTIDQDIKELEILYEKNKQRIIAIGECGLEYKDISEDKGDETKKNQEYMFRKQIELAIKNDLPTIIHCRFAMDELPAILTDYPKPFRGVLHSVDGSIETIQKLIEMGLYVSFNGIMTFKNAENINKLVDAISLEHIILETDAPFLAPVPLRGTQNTPANMKYIYQYLADKKKLPLQKLEEVIEANVQTLFAI